MLQCIRLAPLRNRRCYSENIHYSFWCTPKNKLSIRRHCHNRSILCFDLLVRSICHRGTHQKSTRCRRSKTHRRALGLHRSIYLHSCNMPRPARRWRLGDCNSKTCSWFQRRSRMRMGNLDNNRWSSVAFHGPLLLGEAVLQ